MDKKYMNNFKPMVVTGARFENIDDIIEFGKTQNIVYTNDSMGIVDKIKMLTTITSGIYFWFTINMIDSNSLMTGINIVSEYLTTIPNNSIEILNAKNEFQTVHLIIAGMMNNSEALYYVILISSFFNTRG